MFAIGEKDRRRINKNSYWRETSTEAKKVEKSFSSWDRTNKFGNNSYHAQQRERGGGGGKRGSVMGSERV